MTTAKDGNKISPENVGRGSARSAKKQRSGRTAVPAARKRCRPKAEKEKPLEQSIEAEVLKEMPHIVRANVRKAKQGSLVHTKWLWGVVEKMPKATGAKTTLAELLMEQIPGAGTIRENEQS